jgi:hypothetical protein
MDALLGDDWMEDLVRFQGSASMGDADWALAYYLLLSLPLLIQGAVLEAFLLSPFIHSFPDLLKLATYALMDPDSTFETMEHASCLMCEMCLRDPDQFLE